MHTVLDLRFVYAQRRIKSRRKENLCPTLSTVLCKKNPWSFTGNCYKHNTKRHAHFSTLRWWDRTVRHCIFQKPLKALKRSKSCSTAPKLPLLYLSGQHVSGYSAPYLCWKHKDTEFGRTPQWHIYTGSSYRCNSDQELDPGFCKTLYLVHNPHCLYSVLLALFLTTPSISLFFTPGRNFWSRRNVAYTCLETSIPTLNR